jgi:AmmeMemoRadiSam system protein A
MAVAAAFQDPRFKPLTKGEYSKLEVEISVLTPLVRIEDPGKVKVGTHGIYMRRGGRSGVLLPQVATEQGWNREEFLDATCRKAGLPEKSWKEKDTEIYVFTAQVF